MLLPRARYTKTSAQLERLAAESPDPSAERVLILSDSQESLDAIEDAWRDGEMRKWSARGDGCLIEAICSLRQKFDRVVMAYCPAHRGIAGNEWADAAAKGHLGTEVEDRRVKMVGTPHPF